MQWNINSDKPVYVQLIEQIQTAIISGYFEPSDKLPSVRDLAAEASVNPNTMQRALSEVERMGLIYTNRTSGRYITSDLNLIKELKKNLAKDIISDFLDRMIKFGYEREEILSMISEIVKEMEK